MSTNIRGSNLPTTIPDLTVIDTQLGALDQGIVDDRARLSAAEGAITAGDAASIAAVNLERSDRRSAVAAVRNEFAAADRSQATALNGRMDQLSTRMDGYVADASANNSPISLPLLRLMAAHPISLIESNGAFASVFFNTAHPFVNGDYVRVVDTTNHNTVVGPVTVLSPTNVTIPTTLNLASEQPAYGYLATAGAYVADTSLFPIGSSTTVTNDTAKVADFVVSSYPTSGVVLFDRGVPSSWTGGAKASAGRAVSRNLEALRLSQIPNRTSDLPFPTSFEIVAKADRFRPRAYNRNGTRAAALQAALTAAAPTNGIVEDENGDFPLSYEERISIPSGVTLLMGRDQTFTADYWKGTLSQGSNAGATYVTLNSISPKAFDQQGCAIELDNGNWHNTRILSIDRVQKRLYLNADLPSAASGGNEVHMAWEAAGSSFATAMFNIVGTTTKNWTVEYGIMDGQRDLFPRGRSYGYASWGAADGKFNGCLARNIPSNSVDGVRDYGYGGDGFLLTYVPGMGAGPDVPGSSNIEVNDCGIENCDRNGGSSIRVDGGKVNGGWARNIGPANGDPGYPGAAWDWEDNATNTLNRGWVRGMTAENCYAGFEIIGRAVATVDGLAGSPRASNVEISGCITRGTRFFAFLIQSVGAHVFDNTAYVSAGYGFGVLQAIGWNLHDNRVFGDGNPASRAAYLLGGSSHGKLNHNRARRMYGPGIQLDQRYWTQGIFDITDIEIMHNQIQECLVLDVPNGSVAPVLILAGKLNPTAPYAVNNPTGTQTHITNLRMAHNSISDERDVSDRMYYGVDIQGVTLEDIATWDIGHNPIVGAQTSPYHNLVREARTYYVTQIVSFNAPSNGMAVSNPITIAGVTTTDMLTVTPVPTVVGETATQPSGMWPTGYGQPQVQVTMTDTAKIYYPVASGQSPTGTFTQKMLIKIEKVG